VGKALLHRDHETDRRKPNVLSRSNITRSLIVDAACDVLGESGHGGLTAATLVKQSGISKGGIYHHFDHMDDIVIAAYQKTAREVFTGLGRRTPKTFDAYMFDVEKLLFEGLFKNPKTMRIMHELLPRAMYDNAFGEKRQAIADIGIERQLQILSETLRGTTTEAELRVTLKSVSVFLSGLAIHFQMTGNLGECKEMWASFRTMMSEQVDKL
jgi:AcrR family transcriptional regulator